MLCWNAGIDRAQLIRSSYDLLDILFDSLRFLCFHYSKIIAVSISETEIMDNKYIL